jgi:Flp pilus assembly protein TadD
MTEQMESIGVLYRQCIAEAVLAVRSDHADEGEVCLRRALALDYSRPEAFNTIGILMEIRGKSLQAQNYYRAALSLDPTYKPARNNLDRTVGLREINVWDLGED